MGLTSSNVLLRPQHYRSPARPGAAAHSTRGTRGATLSTTTLAVHNSGLAALPHPLSSLEASRHANQSRAADGYRRDKCPVAGRYHDGVPPDDGALPTPPTAS